MAAKHFTSRTGNVNWLRLARRAGCIGLILVTRSGLGQTNLTWSSGVWTNQPVYRLLAPSDFQRLHYYYLAQPNSPAPGTEQHVFTLGPSGTWNNDWNSKVVPRPTRNALNAVTAQQVDLFRRAGMFTNGVWQIVTSQTNIPLSSLNPTPASYAQIRAVIDHDQMLRQVSQLKLSLSATGVASNATPAAPSQ
jgi:hypothetical protein